MGKSMGHVSSASNDTRFVIEEAVYDIGYAIHFGHYAWVPEVASDASRILDFGCGSGYGAGYLATLGKDVCGADISQEAVNYAADLYPAARFVCTSLDKPLEENPALRQCGLGWDAVISFEVIEHVEDSMNFVRNAAAMVADNGVALIGSPNRLTSFEFNPTYTEDHVHEFTPYQLDQLCRMYFHSVELVGEAIHAPVKRQLFHQTRSFRSRLREFLRSSAWAGSVEMGLWGTARSVLRNIRRLRGNTMTPAAVGYLPLAKLRQDYFDFVTEPGQVKRARGIIAVCRDPVRPQPPAIMGRPEYRMSRSTELLKSNTPPEF
jgi:2-polyprenyl-3-methyl-5-hydroxy-6-metoxy-1,4-benzoquinol methylase